MARNLIGYFGGKPDCNQFSVKIIADPSSDVFEEIYLAGSRPFVVTYDVSKTPFEPIRYSRASISVVASEKFFDVFSEEAQGTQVILEKDGAVEWVGFLTSNLLNMPNDSCGWDTFTLEAQDCLSTLKNYDYQPVSSAKTIVSFEQVLGQIADKCGLIQDMYIDRNLQTSGGTPVRVKNLTISEQNFFSSDTDETWSLDDVLEEICRYCGYTAMQYKNSLYLHDLQMYSTTEWSGSTAEIESTCDKYKKSNHWSTATGGTFINLGTGLTLNQGLIRGSNSDIGLETLYNKIQVRDSFYEIDHFIPDMWEDANLTNRQGDFWKCNEVSYGGKLKFINKAGWEKEEEKSEGDHVYYIRKFDHKYYESVYRDQDTLASGVTPVMNGIIVSNVHTGQYVDDEVHYYPDPDDNPVAWHTGHYDVTATFTNTTSSQKTLHIYSELTYSWWDGYYSMPDYDSDSNNETPTNITLAKSGSTNSARTITITRTCEYPDIYTSSAGYGAYYKIGSAAQTYPITEGQNDDSKKYVGGTIVDLATFDKPMQNDKYNYETEANISFDRYLMIRQNNKPDRQHPYINWLFMEDQTPLNDNQIDAVFPCIFKLKSGYTNPFYYDNKAYLALDANAIFERYDREYINPDWTDENTNLKGLGLFKRLSSIQTCTPVLIFLLKVGNKYWSTQSGWTTTRSCFCVKLGTDKTDEDDVDFTGWWNEDHPVLNNISWTDWAGMKGYKIPLEEGFDMTQPIEFEVHMPSKLQMYNVYDESVIRAGGSGSGINSMCWVKDLDIKFATKDSENYDNSDVLYENVINSGSVNTLSEVTCKITTYPGEGMHSYSNVALNGTLLKSVVRLGLDGRADIPEYNIIKAYTNQYHLPTIKQSYTLGLDVTPLSIIKDPTLDDRYFHMLGTEIDYAAGSQRVSLVEIRPWDTDLDD